MLIDGSAMPTIETSSPSRKRTPQSTTRSDHVRASQRGAAELGEEAIPTDYMQLQLLSKDIL